MKAKNTWAAIIVGSLAILNNESAVSAPVSMAAATVDWSTFSVTFNPAGSNPPPSIIWSNLSSSAFSTTTPFSTSTDPFQHAFDWNTSLSTHAGNLAMFSNATTNAVTLYSYSEERVS